MVGHGMSKKKIERRGGARQGSGRRKQFGQVTIKLPILDHYALCALAASENTTIEQICTSLLQTRLTHPSQIPLPTKLIKPRKSKP